MRSVRTAARLSRPPAGKTGAMLLASFAACLALLAAVPAHGWTIPSYNIRIEIQPDSTVVIAETIVADFTGDPHHGIYRDIPLSGKDRYGNNYRLRCQVLGVTDQSGTALATLTTMKSGRIHIRIGDPDVLLQDIRTYVIRYRLLRGVHFFREHDELYWNAVGQEWEVPIQNATCIVTLPANPQKYQLRTESYTGQYGLTTSDAGSDTPDNRTARFWMTRTLQPGEAMTIVVGWPKGIVIEPPFAQEAGWFVSDNGYFGLPPIFFLGVVLYWRRIGRDPETGRSEVVAYDPPDNLRPAELGTLIDERVDMRDISASIVDLAVRGYIHIKAEAEKAFIGTKTDYLLELTKPNEEVSKDPNLSAFERELIDGLFGLEQSRWVSALKNDFYIHLPKLKDELYNSAVIRGYFSHRPDSVRTTYLVAGLVVVGIGITAAMAIGAVSVISVGWGIALAVGGAILALAARTMPRKTTKGKNALLSARGFEEYLSRAERQEIEYQERHDYFDKFLPYAMALGIADKWARAFDGLQTTPPQWYAGDGGIFRPSLFAHDMSAASSGWEGAMASQPRSSGGGGSGFGGGSSGGGGGGGGGGGW